MGRHFRREWPNLRRWNNTVTDAPTEPPAHDALLWLLGVVTVEVCELLRPKATSVVAFIVPNRSLSTDRLEEACWFGWVDFEHHAECGHIAQRRFHR